MLSKTEIVNLFVMIMVEFKDKYKKSIVDTMIEWGIIKEESFIKLFWKELTSLIKKFFYTFKSIRKLMK